MKTYKIKDTIIVLPKKEEIKDEIIKNLEVAYNHLKNTNHIKTKSWLLGICILISIAIAIPCYRYAFASETIMQWKSFWSIITASITLTVAIVCTGALFTHIINYNDARKKLQNTISCDSYLNDMLYLHSLLKTAEILGWSVADNSSGLHIEYVDNNGMINDEILFETPCTDIIEEKSINIEESMIQISARRNEIQIVTPFKK